MSNVTKIQQGTFHADAITVGSSGAGLYSVTSAPSNGTTLAGIADPGSLLIYANGASSKLYINTNTKASPTWTVVGSQS